MEIPKALSHAYLISGGSADSRRELARRLTAAYLCAEGNPPCGGCRHCRKVAGGIHPDVSVTAPLPDKREIGVDQIRALRTDVYIRPNEGDRKVYLIDPADLMNDNAQNALLKVLEEGPAYAAFLLLAEQPGRLLETVRSRCESIALPPEGRGGDPALREKGGELARMLVTAGEAELAEYLVGLEQEKMKSAKFLDLLAETEDQLSHWLLREPRRTARALGTLKAVREYSHLYPGVGHCLGRMAAEMFR